MVKSCRPKSETNEIETQIARSKGSDLRVHFKNTYETAAAVRGMSYTKAVEYLEHVLEHRRCIPFRKFTGGIGRTAQAKEFKLSQGRWPEKSVKIVLDLLKNAEANANTKGMDITKLYIWHVAVQRAVKGRRRTYRAHGRINPFLSHPCHIEFILKEKEANVPNAKGNGQKTVTLSKKSNASRAVRA